MFKYVCVWKTEDTNVDVKNRSHKNKIYTKLYQSYLTGQQGEIWGGHFHTWRWWGSIDPLFDIFRSHGVPFIRNSNVLTLSFCRKIYLSLSHLVPEIIWPKVGLFFHKTESKYNFQIISNWIKIRKL